jgi:hypothetical protein
MKAVGFRRKKPPQPVRRALRWREADKDRRWRPREFSPKTKIEFHRFVGGVYLENVPSGLWPVVVKRYEAIA